MTSLAFILGVLPLAISTGAGAGARTSVGTGVMGGMLAATFLAIFFVPLFFRVLEDLKLIGETLERKSFSTSVKHAQRQAAHAAAPTPGHPPQVRNERPTR